MSLESYTDKSTDLRIVHLERQVQYLIETIRIVDMKLIEHIDTLNLIAAKRITSLENSVEDIKRSSHANQII